MINGIFGINKSTLLQVDSTPRKPTISWSLPVLSIADIAQKQPDDSKMTNGIFGISKSTLPQVIATTAPLALVRQQQAVDQQLQAPRTTGTTPPTPAFPPDLIKVIANIRKLTCPKPQPPKFFFELTTEAAEKNFIVLKRYNMDLGQAIAAQQASPLDYGAEFKPPKTLQQIFQHHPLWKQMESILNK